MPSPLTRVCLLDLSVIADAFTRGLTFYDHCFESRISLKWLPGVVKRITGSKSVEVRLDTGIICQHIDQVRRRVKTKPVAEEDREVVTQDVRTRSLRPKCLPARFRDE